ncbi:MAG: AMP-binding protein [Lautropia sp.]
MLSPLAVLRRYPPHAGTLRSLLASRSAGDGERPFLVYAGREASYLETLAGVDRVATLLAARGVGAGDRVACMSPNHPATVHLLIALASLGAVMVPINPDYGAAEAAYILGHADVCGVVAAPSALATVRAAIAQAGIAPWLMLNEAAGAGSIEGGASAADATGAPGAPGAASVDAGAAALPLLSDPPPPGAVRPPLAADRAESTCVFIYTSGTTGFPKGVMHAQRSIVTAGEGFVERMHLQPDDRLLCVLPLFHVNAICYSLGGALAAGATLILEPKFSASRFWQVVKDTGATEVNTIAAANSILMRRPRSEFVAGHKLDKIYGAPFDEETYRVFQQEFGVPNLIEGYGMSEIPGALNNPFDGERRVRSMGRPSRHPDPAIALAELKIVDDDGNELPDGETGELVARTPIVMQGYYKDPEQTAAAFRDGWFLTGDLAWRDADGYFWFVARKKDIIRRRGENIAGAELDRVVGNHPDVLEAAAIPVPSELGEDDILVAVVPRPGATILPAAIGDWCRARLAAIKVPRYVAIVDALPHTPTHRIAKFKMRDDPTLKRRAVDLQAP